jgi:hypothetical protein
MALVAGACLGQPLYVPAQDVRPLPFGLFSVADMHQEADGHWGQGVEWQPQSCGPASVWGCPTCSQNNAGNAPNKTIVAGVPLSQAFPFTVYGTFQCSPIGNWDDAVERSRQVLVNGEERAVELEFATGSHSASPSLIAASAIDITPTPGTAVSVSAGVALLESYIGANAPGEGVIIANRREATLAASAHLVHQNPLDMNQLVTKLQTPVAAIGGFNARTGPNNVAAVGSNAWMFALGSAPRIWRGPIFTNPDTREAGLRTTNNNLTILSERNYAVGFDCFAVGVLVASV